MKRIAWINPLTTGATYLDSTISPHDVDHLGLTRLLQREGFEVWLQVPSVKKYLRSAWPKKILTDKLIDLETDAAILCCGPFLVDYLNHHYYREIGSFRANVIDTVTRWLDGFRGEIYLHVTDPRPVFQLMFDAQRRRSKHPLFAHLDRTKILVADTAFLKESLRHRGIVSDYWKVVNVGETLPFCEKEDFFCVYPGSKRQTKTRIKRISEWLDVAGCYTIGDIIVPTVASLSNNKKVSLDTVVDCIRSSKTSLIYGEPRHTWLTPRVIQSLTCGTVCSIHPDFKGVRVLPDDIVKEQTFERASDFNIKEIDMRASYNRQIEFVSDLRSSKAISGVNT